MKPFHIYTVGGAVRDDLLGLPVKDHDYVVVGATPQDMLDAGFTPVGKDFPVFLHPTTHEEYALARTERKVAPGYKGFAFHADASVTLEEDLYRRDLTINAIARAEDGSLIDPYGGQQDVRDKIFRHVSPAFAEDPVRILRAARFAARFAGFTFAPETVQLMRTMVADGEVDALVPERVWQELSRGLMEEKPSRMFVALAGCGALQKLLPELSGLLVQEDYLAIIDHAAQGKQPLAIRWMTVTCGLGAAQADVVRAVSDRLRVPGECRDMAMLGTRYWQAIAGASQASAEGIVNVLEQCDAWRRGERFMELVNGIGLLTRQERLPGFLATMLAAAMSVDAAAIARRTPPPGIPQAIRQARIDAVQVVLPAA